MSQRAWHRVTNNHVFFHFSNLFSDNHTYFKRFFVILLPKKD